VSPQEAAGLVVETVNDGIEAGEVTGGISEEISHKIDEILRELDEDGDLAKSVEKVDELREKVSEALEKGEINSAARASAIDDALQRLAEALGAEP